MLAYYLPGQTAAAGLFVDTPLPSRRVEYFSAGPMWMGILEQRPLDQPDLTRPEGAVVTGEERFTKGESRFQDWNNAVLGPDLSAHNWGTGIARYGDSLQAIVPLFAPSEAGHHGMTFFDLSYVTGSTTLIKDGAVVGRYPMPGLGILNLSPDPASYTLAVQARRDVRWSSLAPSVDTEWTFTTSGSQSGQYLALPTVKISGNLDDRNRAPASTGFPLQLKVGFQANSTAAAIGAVTLEYSSDDGQTWRAAMVARVGDDWAAIVQHPSSGFISLRAKATTVTGDTVQQTIIRAYSLR